MCDISIKFLGKETRDLISALLNPKKIIRNEGGLSRDWYGLAELCGIGGEKIPNIERTNDPTLKVLEIWSDKNKNESTTAKLLSFLETLDRFDVIEDITPLLKKDAEYHSAHPEGFNVELQDIDDEDVITYDDAERKSQGLPPQTYDAFVLFDDDDIGFATDIINTLEGQYNMKLCIKDRDVVGGEYNHDSVIRLISKRCNRVVVVVSPSFLESPTNKYFYTLAQMEGIERQRRKIIPCKYKNCPELPLEFRAYHLLDFTRLESTFGNFWDQLYKSIKVVIPPSTRPALPERETVAAPKRSTGVAKPVNHVKFGIVEQREEPVEAKIENDLPTEETPVENPASVASTPSTFEPIQKELKKANPFYRKFQKLRKIVQHKNNKEKQVEEAPQINGLVPKKKWLWNRNKVKIPVAN